MDSHAISGGSTRLHLRDLVAVQFQALANLDTSEEGEKLHVTTVDLTFTVAEERKTKLV